MSIFIYQLNDGFWIMAWISGHHFSKFHMWTAFSGKLETCLVKWWTAFLKIKKNAFLVG